MAVLFEITEGWTKRIGPLTLRNNGAAIDLTGMTIQLIMRGRNDVEILIPTSRVEKEPQTGATLGQVFWQPIPGDTVGKAIYSPYTFRWEVVDGNGKQVYFPNGAADTVNIYKR